jgi:hypothetical protein
MASPARGGLEPSFRVLFSTIFPGVSLGNFHQGRNRWKWAEAKVWSFVAALHTNFLYVLVVLTFPRGYGEPQYYAVLSQGMIYLRVRGLGPVKHWHRDAPATRRRTHW